MLVNARTVHDCLNAHAMAREGELSDRRVFERLERVARNFNDWFNVLMEVDQDTELGKSIVEHVKSMQLTFDEWDEVHRVSSNSTLYTHAMNQMVSMASTFPQLRRVYGLVTERKDLDNILKTLVLRASTLDEKVQVYELVVDDVNLREAISQDIMSTTKDFADWEKVLEESEVGSELERFAATKAVESAPDTLPDLLRLCEYDAVSQDMELWDAVLLRLRNATISFNEWKDTFESLNEGHDLEHFVASILVDRAEDPKALAEAVEYNFIYNDDKLREAVLEKLRGSSASFDIWNDMRENERDEVQGIATEKMIDAVENIEQVRQTAEAFDGDDDAEEKLATRLKLLEVDKKDLEKILEDFSNDHVLFIAAFEKLLDMADTAIVCLKLHTEWELGDDENDKVLKKFFTLVTPSECAIIALVAEEGSDFREMAEQQVSDEK